MRRALEKEVLLLVVLEAEAQSVAEMLASAWLSWLERCAGERCGCFIDSAGHCALVSRWAVGREGREAWWGFVASEAWREAGHGLRGQPTVLLLVEEGQPWPANIARNGGLLCVTRDATIALREDRRKQGPQPGLKLATRSELPELPAGAWAWPVLGHQGRLLVALAENDGAEAALAALEAGGWSPLVETPRRWGPWSSCL